MWLNDSDQHQINLFPFCNILFHLIIRFLWWDSLFWPLHDAMYRAVHSEYPVVRESTALQGLLVSYSISISSSASSYFVPHLCTLLSIRKLLFWNFRDHLFFHSGRLLIVSEKRISELIFSKLFRVEIAVSFVSEAEVKPARKIFENFIFYVSIWDFVWFWRSAISLIRFYGWIIAPPFIEIGLKLWWRRAAFRESGHDVRHMMWHLTWSGRERRRAVLEVLEQNLDRQ